DGHGSGLQGGFRIGLLSFWTVGDRLTMTSTGTDQKAYQMTMSKGDSRYEVSPKRILSAEKGTQPKLPPLLASTPAVTGRKIGWSPASERRGVFELGAIFGKQDSFGAYWVPRVA